MPVIEFSVLIGVIWVQLGKKKKKREYNLAHTPKKNGITWYLVPEGLLFIKIEDMPISGLYWPDWDALRRQRTSWEAALWVRGEWKVILELGPIPGLES